MANCKWSVSEEKKAAFMKQLTDTYLYTLVDLEARTLRCMKLLISIKRNGPIKERCCKTIREAHGVYERTLHEALVFQATVTECTCNGKCQQLVRDAFQEGFPLLSKKIDPKSVRATSMYDIDSS